MRRFAFLLFLTLGCGSSTPPPAPPTSARVIEIDIDDHGLLGLWAARAPNLKGLIQRGTLAFSRVLIPTHSNQNNMSLLTGQYPDGTNVPANAWLSRSLGLAPPLSIPGLAAGDYALYDKNPLRVRGDSLYEVARRAGVRSGYFGQLPPFEGTADEVHLTLVGAPFLGGTLTADVARQLLTQALHYPTDVVDRYHFDRRDDDDEGLSHFTIRDAAEFIRTAPNVGLIPQYLFVWDFLALDDDATSTSGASGPDLVAAVEDYDAAIGKLLEALANRGLSDETNIVFTLDHGKVDTHKQVVLGTHGTTNARVADGQLGAAVAAMGPALGISPADYAIVNEDGDAQLYANVAGAGTPAGAARQREVTHALLSIVQSGAIQGLDVTRTMTADGAMGTRRFSDVRASGPNQADIVVFPEDDWTLNQVDAQNSAPGRFVEHTEFPYGRHGGFSVDELYVPLILAGPAFKQGVLLPHPVEHPGVAATAAWALGGQRLTTADRGAITAALAGDPGEAVPLPTPLSTSRALALAASGNSGGVALVDAPAAGAVVIDVAGLYDEEIFSDPALASEAAALRDLAARGARFEDVWTRSRDWPVTEYQLLAGAYPARDPWISMAEDDPTQTVLPAAGLLAMPPPTGRIANRPAYQEWRKAEPFTDESLFGAARAAGLKTALVGRPDFHPLHLPAGEIDEVVATDDAGAAAAVRELLSRAPRSMVVVALGGRRTSDRHAPSARKELAALTAAVRDVASAAGDALVVVTSRGATTMEDDGSDFYGAGSSRHVPLVVAGPNVRAGVVSGQPGAPADIPATVLFGLGWPSVTDFADGTRAVAPTSAAAGAPQLAPRGAFEGHVLLRAFTSRSLQATLARRPDVPAGSR